MEQQIYAIRDSKAAVYTAPIVKLTHGVAERDFHTMCKNPESPISKYPEDYDLFHLGTYDEQTGKINLLDAPHHMIKAIDVINR